MATTTTTSTYRNENHTTRGERTAIYWGLAVLAVALIAALVYAFNMRKADVTTTTQQTTESSSQQMIPPKTDSSMNMAAPVDQARDPQNTESTEPMDNDNTEPVTEPAADPGN